MQNLGFSELVILATIAVPVAVAIAPVVFVVIVWRRLTDISRRLERIEEFLQHRDRAP
jgi:hypothetical protein